jgi:hypothetical protein
LNAAPVTIEEAGSVHRAAEARSHKGAFEAVVVLLDLGRFIITQIVQQLFSFSFFSVPLDHVKITCLFLQAFQQRLVFVDDGFVLAQAFLVVETLLRCACARREKSTLGRH